MKLGELIDSMQVGQVAKATFAIKEYWFIKMIDIQQIRYCIEDGTYEGDIVGLTYSNLKADYEIVGVV